MPIVYNSESNSWQLKDATPEEKAALIEAAKDMIVEFFGDAIADEIVTRHFGKVELKDIAKEDMGTA